MMWLAIPAPPHCQGRPLRLTGQPSGSYGFHATPQCQNDFEIEMPTVRGCATVAPKIWPGDDVKPRVDPESTAWALPTLVTYRVPTHPSAERRPVRTLPRV